jgi:hypothetical protein
MLGVLKSSRAAGSCSGAAVALAGVAHLRPGSNEPFPIENQMSAIRLEPPQEVLKHGVDEPFSSKAILRLRLAGGSP